jgi:type I restriction enzyme M protein
MLNAELKSKISQLWNKFWAGGLTNPLTAIEQISYLIFMKRLEDLDQQHENQAIARGEKFESLFKGNQGCRWSEWKHKSAEQMLQHVRDKVFPFIKNIRRGEDTAFSENMKDAVFIIPKPSLLQEAVSIIDDIYDSAQAGNGDTLGDI